MITSLYFTNRKTFLFGEFKYYNKSDVKLTIEFLGGTVVEAMDDTVDILYVGMCAFAFEFLTITKQYPKAIICFEGKGDDYFQEFPDLPEYSDGIFSHLVKLAKQAKGIQ